MPGDLIQKKSTDSFEFQGLFNKTKYIMRTYWKVRGLPLCHGSL